MDVGAVFGKGKGKGKKGDRNKGQEKGSSEKGKGKYEKGDYGKGAKKGIGKGAKGKDTATNQVPQGERIQGYCSSCGKWGHPARSCWSTKPVGFVDADNSELGPSASEMASSSSSSVPPVGAIFYDMAKNDETEQVPVTSVEDQEVKWCCAIDHATVNMVQNQYDEIYIDSGSVATCCPKNYAKELMINTDVKSKLCDVQGAPLRTYGQKTANYTTGGPDLQMKFEVSDVKKLISSAANMVDAGIELHFTDKGCWAQKGKQFIPIERKGKLFVLKVKRKQGRVQATPDSTP